VSGGSNPSKPAGGGLYTSSVLLPAQPTKHSVLQHCSTTLPQHMFNTGPTRNNLFAPWLWHLLEGTQHLLYTTFIHNLTFTKAAVAPGAWHTQPLIHATVIRVIMAHVVLSLNVELTTLQHNCQPADSNYFPTQT
jgi:hypothetical protein